MAITINSQPSSYTSMHEPLWFIVGSDNTSETNFKYVCDIYINNNLVARLKSFPDPNSSKGIFNVSSIVRNYWQSYFKPLITLPTSFTYTGSDIYVNYVCKFGEEYDGTTYLNLEETDSFAYNWYNDFMCNVVSGGYLGGNGLATFAGTFITFRDKNQLQIDKNKLGSQRMFISYLASEENSDFDFSLNVTSYSNGTPTNYVGSTVTDRDFALIDLSPAAVNRYLGTSAITSLTDYYNVSILENDVVMDTVKVNVDCFPKSDSYNLHFLNSLGGYDTMLFPLVNRQSRTASKKSYGAYDYEYNASTMTMDRKNSHGIINGGNTNFWIEQTLNMKLTSNWINQTDYTWLKELLFSPEVYLEIISDTYIPVHITDSTWQEKKIYQDKQFNLELNIEFSPKVNSQYR